MSNFNLYDLYYENIWRIIKHRIARNKNEIIRIKEKPYTPPIPEILCAKNVRTILVCWFKNVKRIFWKYGKNRGSCLVVACYIPQPIQPNLDGNGLDWLCYLAGNYQKVPTVFSYFQHFFFKLFKLRTHKPQLPSNFWHIIF